MTKYRIAVCERCKATFAILDSDIAVVPGYYLEKLGLCDYPPADGCYCCDSQIVGFEGKDTPLGVDYLFIELNDRPRTPML